MKIPSSILRARIKKVVEKLRQENLQGLVIYSTGTALGFTSHTHGYLRYLCNWNGQNSASVLILILGREPILLVSLPYLYSLARETIWFNDVRFVPSTNFGHEIVRILKPVISRKQKIGYIGRMETPVPLYEALLQGLKGVKWVEVNRIIDELRLKSVIECLRLLNEKLKTAKRPTSFRLTWNVRPGMKAVNML